jgi:acyl-CoA synthetase (AMP-forming)/AMP-acid ligase II
MTLSTSYWPADFSQPVVDLTVGDALRGAAAEAPDATALVEGAPGQTPDPDELFAYCREHLAPRKTPRYWTVIEQFPITPSGKIQKFVLRERFLARGPDLAIQAESTDTAAATPPAP